MSTDKLSELIVNYCTENELAVIELQDPRTKVRLFMIAVAGTINSESASILSAHMLLSSIVHGGLAKAEQVLSEEANPQSVN